MFTPIVPRVGQALEPLVGFLKPHREARAISQPSLAVVLGDETAQQAVEVLNRLDQAERGAGLASAAMSSNPEPRDGAGISRLRRERLSETSMARSD